MLTANCWKDYEVVDASHGEKLERWGDFILLRPDPQVIWDTPECAPEWKRINAHYHRSSKGGGSWEIFTLPETWQISYSLGLDHGFNSGKLTFNLKPMSFKHTGIFPEQAVNWEWFSEIIRREKNRSPERKIKILNLFAYTGAATIAAAKSGAVVTHVDSSAGMVKWAKENAEASDVLHENTRWLVDDCTKFTEREIRRGSKYDAVIMDPPSYGRGPKGEIWKMEDDIYEFICRCSHLLTDEPLFFLINSYTTGLQPGVLTYMLKSVLTDRFGGTVTSDEIGLPVRSNGLILPCGASGRWYFK